MRLLLVFLSMLLPMTVFADAGTTFCPHPNEFKYDPDSGMMVAPGGWEFQIGSPAKVKSFVKVLASESNGRIYDCRYNIHVYGTSFQFPVEAPDYRYVADNIHSPVWHRGAEGMVCISSLPEKCKFHLAN